MINNPKNGKGFPSKEHLSNTWAWNLQSTTSPAALPTPTSDVFVAKIIVTARSDNATNDVLITPLDQDNIATNNYITLKAGDSITLYGKPAQYQHSSNNIANIQLVYHLA